MAKKPKQFQPGDRVSFLATDGCKVIGYVLALQILSDQTLYLCAYAILGETNGLEADTWWANSNELEPA